MSLHRYAVVSLLHSFSYAGLVPSGASFATVVSSVDVSTSNRPAQSTVASPALVSPSVVGTPVSDCVHQGGPSDDVAESCYCSGYDGNLPVLPGPSPCAYTAVTGSPIWPPAPTSTSTQLSGVIGFPFTSTKANSAIVAYATTTNMGEGPLMTGSSTTLHYGKSMAVQLAASSSVNVGTLTGEPLYTAISSALMAACTEQPENPSAPTVPTASVTACEEVPKITAIVQTDNKGNWDIDAELEINIKLIKYFDLQSFQGMVSSIASSLSSSSLQPNSTWKPEKPHCNLLAGWCTNNELPNAHVNEETGDPGITPATIANVPGFIVATYTQDTAENPGWPVQDLVVELAIHEIGGDFLCADGALITDGLAALALVPGLEFLDFMAVPALGVSATCDAIEHSEPAE